MFAQFKKHLESLEVSPHTARAYISDLGVAEKAGIINKELTKINLSNLVALNKNPGTLRRIRASIRKYANYMVSNGHIIMVPPVLTSTELPKIKRKIPRVIHAEGMKNLIKNVNDVEIKLILLIFSTTGCRISSLADLKIQDFGEETITFHTAKGGKPYISILSKETKKAFNAFRGLRTDGYLFTKRGGGKATPGSIRMRLIRELGSNYANPHSFRHGVATELMSAGADIYDVKEFMNHTSVSVTEGYAHLAPAHTLSKLKGKHPLL